MLKEALEARLPLVAIYTNDKAHIGRLVTHLSGCRAVNYELFGKYPESLYFVMLHPEEDEDWLLLYSRHKEHRSTLIVVNPPETDSLMFDAGTASVPKELLSEFLSECVEGDFSNIEAMLGGLSLKEVHEVISIASTMPAGLHSSNILAVRRNAMAAKQGVTLVDPTFSYYKPSQEVRDWVKVQGRLFMREGIPLEIQPRGLLFDGPPGTGKTLASKHIARHLGIPLFHLSLGSTMGKYVGESERNLNNALEAIDKSAPCILLLDEVEKVFARGEDNGVTSRLLSTLLWWLQEHTSKVFTIMTTNAKDKLPPELYRPGRIDRVLETHLIPPLQIGYFIDGLVCALEPTLKPICTMTESFVTKLKKGITKDKPIAHAELTHLVHTKIQEEIINGKTY